MKIAFRLLACGLVFALVGCETPTTTKEEVKETAAAGLNVFSETNRVASVADLVGGANSENGTATIALDSTAVTGKDGSAVIALNPGTGTWGGGYVQFTAVDASSYTNLVLSINTSDLKKKPTSMEIKLESGDVGNAFNLMALTPVKSGAWSTYTVPLAQYTSKVGIGYANAALPDLKSLKSVGLWNPGVTGTLYVDDIHFE